MFKQHGTPAMPFDTTSTTRLPLIRDTKRGPMIVAEVGDEFDCPACGAAMEIFEEDANQDSLHCHECGADHLLECYAEEIEAHEDPYRPCWVG